METDMNAPLKICPICGDGQLTPKAGKHHVEYEGVARDIDLRYSVCSACGSEQGDATQMRENKRAMTRFKKEVDGLLAGSEIRALREQLGINQVEAARIFGGGPVAFSKYEADDITQSEGMDKLLRVARNVPDAYAYLRELAGLRVNPWLHVDLENPTGCGGFSR
jgi:HTH-type transcriptional regulator/antitoxin MqsA